MKAKLLLIHGALAVLVLAAGCEGKDAPAANGVIQTKFPGQVTAGGASSGQVMAATARRETDATYAGGTPGIAGGSGGNTSGAETAGAVQESGQGPSRGTSQPASAGRPGATLQSGDTSAGGAASAKPGESVPASNAAPQGPAASGKAEGK